MFRTVPGVLLYGEVLASRVSFFPCNPLAQDFALEAPMSTFLLTGACACIFSFFSDGGQHAHCRRDRTYLFLSASISRAVHEQTGETMNDDVCVLLYSFTSFF